MNVFRSGDGGQITPFIRCDKSKRGWKGEVAVIFFQYVADISRTSLFEETRAEAVDTLRAKGIEAKESFMPPEYSARMVNGINEKFAYLFKTEKTCCVQVVDAAYDQAVLAACCKVEDMSTSELDRIILGNWENCKILSREEITLADFENLFGRGEHRNYGQISMRKLAEEFQLNIYGQSIWDSLPYKLDETLSDTDGGMTKKQCAARAKAIMASADFCAEIDRIYSRENAKEFYGHPVHYLITAGDFGAAKDMIDILVPALLHNKRLLSRREVIVSQMGGRVEREERFPQIFSSSSGGTVIIRMPEHSDLKNMATELTMIMEKIGEMLEKYGKNTLFIFADVSGKSLMSSEAVKTIQTYADMIHITEGSGSYQKAVKYLDRLARKAEYKDYRLEDVTKYLPEKDSYSVSDIFEAYNKWYANGLKSHVYKAYREIDTYKLKIQKKESKPYEKLMDMVGLTDVKKVVDEILDAAKINSVRKLMGCQDSENSMHMLFYGNPGTAKTTVARLLAQILKEEGVLANGHLVECGRQDLVGRYVGWTAKIVEEKFHAARGGVLFIDEAYSLVDDSNTFGAEAINTIVQQMENYRDEVIVILAGYPDKMRTFLAQNEGLNSRIAFHLNFPDYTGKELTDILALMMEQRGYRMGDGAQEKCLSICSEACQYENFGNGRFVRNLLEQATMRQSSRIIKEYRNEDITKELTSELLAEDFAMPPMASAKAERRMGF